MKELLAAAIANRVKDRQVLGLGSGTTAECAVLKIGERVRAEHLEVYGVPTSLRIASVAAESGIKVLSPAVDSAIDWAFDGADEVDESLRLIKGRGGAMLLEKIVARRAGSLVILVTGEKLVTRLGSKFAVPVAVCPEGVGLVTRELLSLGAVTVTLRQSDTKYGAQLTEQGHLILDAKFLEIGSDLEQRIKCIPAVAESGLFFGYAHEVLVARDGIITVLKPDAKVNSI